MKPTGRSVVGRLQQNMVVPQQLQQQPTLHNTTSSLHTVQSRSVTTVTPNHTHHNLQQSNLIRQHNKGNNNNNTINNNNTNNGNNNTNNNNQSAYLLQYRQYHQRQLQQQSRTNINTEHSIRLNTQQRRFYGTGDGPAVPKDPTDPSSFKLGNQENIYGPYRKVGDFWGPENVQHNGSTDRYFQHGAHPTVLRSMTQKTLREEKIEMRRKYRDDEYVKANILLNQSVLHENIRQLENTALRERIYGASQTKRPVDQHMRNFERRQRFLLEKIYKQQVEAVVKEFEEDYAPLVAIHLRKQKRSLFWQAMRHRFRFLIYPFSLTFNALRLAWKIYRHRRDQDTRLGPRLLNDVELYNAKAAIRQLRNYDYKQVIWAPTKRAFQRMTAMFSTQRELLNQRAMIVSTELLRFRRYSNVNNPKQLYQWLTSRSKYDPQQYELRQQITNNLTTGLKGVETVHTHLRKNPKDYYLDPSNETFHLRGEDVDKPLMRILHNVTLHLRLTAAQYGEQPWIVRKIREWIDAWYDFYKPMWNWRFIVWRKAWTRRKIERLIKKEVYKQQKMEQKLMHELEKGKNPNSWETIKFGIKYHGNIPKYLKYRFKLWFNTRRHATLYDVAKKNRRFFEGPSGPPFWRVYLQTKHLLRSPLGRIKLEKLTVGQEDAKSFFRKWSDMTHDMRRYPKLRSLIWTAAHDNLMLRSTIYFKISRFLRNRKPQIDELKENYFKEVIRVYYAIFHKKERYSFHELYALSLQEWWYPTQNSIKKFDRFDRRVYDRWNFKDHSIIFSIYTICLTALLYWFAYMVSIERRNEHQQHREEEEKLIYSAKGADVSHYADQLLYIDRREYIINELKYAGLMKLHDEMTSRAGKLIDAYYSILDEARKEKEVERLDPPGTLVYRTAELANIANVMKGKARDYELADDIVIKYVQQLWFDAARLFLMRSDISHDPMKYPEDDRQEHADIGTFLMAHIDKIAQSASFPEYEGEPEMEYVLDNGVIRLKPVKGEHGIVLQRAFSQDQEERQYKTGYMGSQGPTKYLTLSEAVRYIDHTDDCGLSKLARLETNLQMFLQLLDGMTKMQEELETLEREQFRILEIPTSEEIAQMQDDGTFESWIKEWHNKQRQLLPHAEMPQNFGELKAKQILKDTGNKHAAVSWLHYYNRYIRPGQFQAPLDEFGDVQTAFDLKDDDLTPHDELLYQINQIETQVEKTMRVLRPHVNLIIQNINRLVQLRPRLYRQVKDDMQRKFVGLTDLDFDVDDIQNRVRPDYVTRFNRAQDEINYHYGHLVGHSTPERMSWTHRIPLLMLHEMENRKLHKGEALPEYWGRESSKKAPKPSEMRAMGITQKDLDKKLMDETGFTPDEARKKRALGITNILQHAIVYKDPVFNIAFTPDNWDTIYEPMLYGWELDELKKRTKPVLQWFHGRALPTQIELFQDPSPKADEFDSIITPFDEHSYYDAWTDMYQLTARTKNRKDPTRMPEEVFNKMIWRSEFGDMEEQTDLYWVISFAGLARRIPETYKFKYETYKLRQYGTDHEFWSNRSLFYSKLDRYFWYFKYFLNREWGRDILDENQRWRKFKRWITGKKKAPDFYEKYFVTHGFYHFLTSNPIYAAYGNDFFFRYFIDAPRFDRRPMALWDQHRYDKDGEDIYFDALYDSRILNNPVPVHIEHMQWSLKPWHEFVNAQFAVYRYIIASGGDYPPEFPHLLVNDAASFEHFVTPDRAVGYDHIWTWGKDIFDPHFKKHKPKFQGHFDKIFPSIRTLHKKETWLDFKESYRP